MQFEEDQFLQQEIASIKGTTERNLNYKTKFNHYADRQLSHLVISENFDFEQIARILTHAFINEKVQFSQKTCRQRWYQLHRDRDHLRQIKEQSKQNKRLQAIIGFRNPYSLYNTDELIQNLQKNQKNTKQFEKIQEPLYTGYNIFKHSIRNIENLQQYQKSKQNMTDALLRTQQQKQKLSQKPLFFFPNYGNSKFEVSAEELTPELANKFMSFPIQIERIQRQLSLPVQSKQTPKYESKIKAMTQRQRQLLQMDMYSQNSNDDD